MDRAYWADQSPYIELIELAKKKRAAVLATIIEADGSTPQVPGASALFSEDGLVCGTIGGGFVEAAAEKRARRAFKKKEAFVCSFDLAGEPSEEADGICGGRLTVLLDARPERDIPVFKRLREAAMNRRSGVLAVWIEKDRGRGTKKILRHWIPKNFRPFHPSLQGFEKEIKGVIREGKPVLIKGKSGWLYLEPHLPLPRLVIAGAGHVGRAVARLGKLLRFEVIVVDDRPEFANAGRFPEADQIIVAEVGNTLREIPVSKDTYIVIVTRGHRHDEEALRACVKSRAAYIGMIGSARKVRLMRKRFINKGRCTAEEWARVRTPIGLPIGSKTVEEIAVSIAAELVAVRSRKKQEVA